MNTLRPRCTAVLVAVAFVLGTIAIPTLHLTFHNLPHDHAGGETHYASSEPHEHGGAHGRHRHHHPDHPRSPFDPRHGEGSASHFSLAISDGAETLVPLLPVALVETALVAPSVETAIVAAHVSVQRFRGPPARG